MLPKPNASVNKKAFFTRTCGVLSERTASFFRSPLSVVPVACVFLLLMAAVYALSGARTLTGEVSGHLDTGIQFYLLDYRVGFVSRALIGSLLSLFVKQYTLSLIVWFLRCSIAVSFVLQAALAACALRAAFLKKDWFVCAAAVVFVCSPVTVLCNAVYFGALDVFNLILTLAYFFNVRSKPRLWLLPLIGFTGIMIHPDFILFYFPAMAAMQLYLICREEMRRRQRIAVLCVSVVIVSAAAVYLSFYSRYSVLMTPEQLYDYVCAKFPFLRSAPHYSYTLDTYVFSRAPGETYATFADFLKKMLETTSNAMEGRLIPRYAAVVLPVAAFFFCFWGALLRRAVGAEKLPYLVFLAMPLLMGPLLLIITDTLRVVSAVVICQFLLLFGVYQGEDPIPADLREKRAACAVRKRLRLPALLLFLSYLICCAVLAPSFHR